jgi:hypothetical protein
MSSKICGTIRKTMAGREESPKYTLKEIVEFNHERRITDSRAFGEGDASYTLGPIYPHAPVLIFSERLKERAKLEMEAEFKRRKMEINKPLPPASSQK